MKGHIRLNGKLYHEDMNSSDGGSTVDSRLTRAGFDGTTINTTIVVQNEKGRKLESFHHGRVPAFLSSTSTPTPSESTHDSISQRGKLRVKTGPQDLPLPSHRQQTRATRQDPATRVAREKQVLNWPQEDSDEESIAENKVVIQHRSDGLALWQRGMYFLSGVVVLVVIVNNIHAFLTIPGFEQEERAFAFLYKA
ncbi:hypothetical protein QCA50_000853 [Cerrena zonata]|uniref:Uncharacterized protein n=1 Tax=Cerrena zonata TaxID=2478898 RepID=A0AAW0GY07_9APHY